MPWGYSFSHSEYPLYLTLEHVFLVSLVFLSKGELSQVEGDLIGSELS
jgi:hypothetical protein